MVSSPTLDSVAAVQRNYVRLKEAAVAYWPAVRRVRAIFDRDWCSGPVSRNCALGAKEKLPFVIGDARNPLVAGAAGTQSLKACIADGNFTSSQDASGELA